MTTILERAIKSDPVGRLIQVKDPLGRLTTTVYDSRGLVLATANPLNQRTTSAYDSMGWRTSLTDPLGRTTGYRYDVAGQRLGVVNPLSSRVTTAYDGNGRVRRVQNAAGNITTSLWDAANRPVATIDAELRRTTVAYNKVGWRTAVVDGAGHRTTFSYDLAGRQTVSKNALDQRTTFTYSACDRVTQRLDARNYPTTYTYDAAGQRTRQRYPDGTRATSTYDAVGNLTQLADWTGTTTSKFDSRNLQTETANPDGKRLTSTYDAARQRTRLVAPGGGRTSYSYDAASRLTRVINPQGERTTLVYDAAGRQTRTTLGNSTSTSTTYDAAGRTTRVFHRKSAGALILATTYAYDKADNRTGFKGSDGDRVTYLYDKTNQLTGENRTGSTPYRYTFVYDAAGNRTKLRNASAITTTVYDSANRIRFSQDGSGRTTYTYDAAGNQTRQKTPALTITTSSWDYENRQTRVIDADGVRTTYTWTAASQRTVKTTPTETAKVLWDGVNVVQEYDGSGITQAEYTLAPQPQPQPYGDLVSERRSNASSFYHFDALGSTQALSDPSQVVTDQYTYEAFGKVAGSSGTTPNPYTWVGEKGYYSDSESGLYSLRRREYGPAGGRFLSEDPIGFNAGDGNLYRYVGNAPSEKIDPSGLTEPPHFPPPTGSMPGVANNGYPAGVWPGDVVIPPGPANILPPGTPIPLSPPSDLAPGGYYYPPASPMEPGTIIIMVPGQPPIVMRRPTQEEQQEANNYGPLPSNSLPTLGPNWSAILVPPYTPPVGTGVGVRELNPREVAINNRINELEDLLRQYPYNDYFLEELARARGDEALANQIALQRMQSMWDAWVGVFGTASSGPGIGLAIHGSVKYNKPGPAQPAYVDPSAGGKSSGKWRPLPSPLPPPEPSPAPNPTYPFPTPPAGRIWDSSTAKDSDGTTLSRNIREQLAFDIVRANPCAGAQIDIKLRDPRWRAEGGWIKMKMVVNGGGGEGPIEVHYVYNVCTGQIGDLKIVYPGTRPPKIPQGK
jgi:RHS repeat-associated protein